MKKVSTALCFFLPEEFLPNKFQYPGSYRSFVSREIEAMRPWRFMYEEEVRGPGGIPQGLKVRYPARSLVPFARRSDNDDIACFDASKPSPDPEVLIIHDYASPGWELHGQYTNFDAWFVAAREDSFEWYKERWDALPEEERQRILKDHEESGQS